MRLYTNRYPKPIMDIDNDNIDDQEQSSIINDKNEIIARHAVRFILSSSESQNTIISRTRLMNVIREATIKENGSSVQFLLMFPLINKILDDVYGLKLQGLNAKSTISKERTQVGSNSNDTPEGVAETQDTGHRGQYFILLNNLPYIRQLEEFKLEQISDTYRTLIQDGEYLGNSLEVESSNTVNSKLYTDQDLVLKGLISLVLSIVLFSKNNILFQELLQYLSSFGVPIDGSKIPIIDIDVESLLKVLERREYLLKLEENSETEGKTILYRIGRRAQVEFDLDSLTRLVQEIMGLDESESKSLKEDIRKVIGDSYNS